MYQRRGLLLIASVCLLLSATAWGQSDTFAGRSAAPNPDKNQESNTASVGSQAQQRALPGPPGPGLTFFTDQTVFEAAFPGLPVEDFEEGVVSAGSLEECPAPLDETSANVCFAAGDILTGIQFTDAPGPDSIDGLVLLGAGVSLNPTKVVLANEFPDAFEVLFDSPVTAAGMHLHSTPNIGEGPPDTVTIQLFDEAGASLGTTSAAASGPGDFWGFSSATPIGRISLESDNDHAEGVDNIQFSIEPALAVNAVTNVDLCGSEPMNENGIVEPGETIEMSIELTAMFGDFTGISGTLSTANSAVTILSGATTWPDLSEGNSSTGDMPFLIRMGEALTCLTDVDFDFQVTASEGGPFDFVIAQSVGQSLTPNVPLSIPDNNPGGVSSNLVIADDVTLTDVNVRANIDHTWVGDLLISLRAPDNTEVILLDRPGVPPGTGCGNNNMDVVFDDDSAFDPEPHCAGTDPWYMGDAMPVGNLANFNGSSSAGTWTLFVSDNASLDLGTIVDWELITTPVIEETCDVCLAQDTDLEIVASSDAAGPVRPGATVVYTLDVTNNGPGVGYGIQVTDDLPTALTYVSNDCGGMFAAPTFTWSAVQLAASSSMSCVITMTVPPAAPTQNVLNTAEVSGLDPDPVAGNNSSTTAVSVVAFNSLEVPTLNDLALLLFVSILLGAGIHKMRS